MLLQICSESRSVNGECAGKSSDSSRETCFYATTSERNMFHGNGEAPAECLYALLSRYELIFHHLNFCAELKHEMKPASALPVDVIDSSHTCPKVSLVTEIP